MGLLIRTVFNSVSRCQRIRVNRETILYRALLPFVLAFATRNGTDVWALANIVSAAIMGLAVFLILASFQVEPANKSAAQFAQGVGYNPNAPSTLIKLEMIALMSFSAMVLWYLSLR